MTDSNAPIAPVPTGPAKTVTLAQLTDSNARDAEISALGLVFEARIRRYPTAAVEIAARRRLAAALDEARAVSSAGSTEGEDAELPRLMAVYRARLAVDERREALEGLASWLVSWGLLGENDEPLPLDVEALYALGTPTGVFQEILAAVDAKRMELDAPAQPASAPEEPTKAPEEAEKPDTPADPAPKPKRVRSRPAAVPA